MKKITAMSLTLALLLSLLCIPAQAAGSWSEGKEEFLAVLQALLEGGEYRTDATQPIAGASKLPASFDLRNVNGKSYVPEVKDQDPWGTCWAFASCAASEISILSELKMSPTEFAAANNGEAMDLSEKHLTWFSMTPLPETDDSQPGEGMHLLDTSTTAPYNEGGFPSLAVSAYAAGMGAVKESAYPYTNRAGQKTESGDWSLPESDRFYQSVELEHSNFLPEVWVWDGDEEEYFFDENAVDAIKSEVYAGRAVAFAYYACEEDEPYWNESTSSHYTDWAEYSNHEVTIVGWDDNYAVSNFTNGHQPPAAGAWLVRNNWGSEWGQDGYFWLSYYDQSFRGPTSFDFVTKNGSVFTETDMDIEEYDLMPVDYVKAVVTTDENYSSNVFQVADGYVLQYVSVLTGMQNTNVTASIYLLKDNYQSPEDGTLLDTVSGKFDYSGYHRMALNQNLLLPAGSSVSVVVNQKVPLADGTSYPAIVVPMGKEYETSYSEAVVNEGESFVKFSGVWEDWRDTIQDIVENCEDAEDYAIDNQAIKLYGYDLSELGELHHFAVDGNTYTCTDDNCGYSYLEYTAGQIAAALPFTDVSDGDYFYDAVSWAVDNAITGGTSSTAFSPDASTTRGQMVTFLWRAAGSPEPTTTENPFADVDVNSYYGKAVLWAVEQGITNGVTATKFAPNATVTRAQAVALLYRANGTPSVEGQKLTFQDVQTDAYYRDAVLWAVKEEITGGTGKTTFSPDAPCTRGQIVTFLYRNAM